MKAIAEARLEYCVEALLKITSDYVNHYTMASAYEGIEVAMDSYLCNRTTMVDDRVYQHTYLLATSVADENGLDILNPSHATAIINRAKRKIDSLIADTALLNAPIPWEVAESIHERYY